MRQTPSTTPLCLLSCHGAHAAELQVSVSNHNYLSLCRTFTATVEKAANKHQQENSMLAVEMDG